MSRSPILSLPSFKWDFSTVHCCASKEQSWSKNATNKADFKISLYIFIYTQYFRLKSNTDYFFSNTSPRSHKNIHKNQMKKNCNEYSATVIILETQSTVLQVARWECSWIFMAVPPNTVHQPRPLANCLLEEAARNRMEANTQRYTIESICRTRKWLARIQNLSRNSWSRAKWKTQNCGPHSEFHRQRQAQNLMSQVSLRPRPLISAVFPFLLFPNSPFLLPPPSSYEAVIPSGGTNESCKNDSHLQSHLAINRASHL